MESNQNVQHSFHSIVSFASLLSRVSCIQHRTAPLTAALGTGPSSGKPRVEKHKGTIFLGCATVGAWGERIAEVDTQRRWDKYTIEQ